MDNREEVARLYLASLRFFLDKFLPGFCGDIWGRPEPLPPRFPFGAGHWRKSRFPEAPGLAGIPLAIGAVVVVKPLCLDTAAPAWH